ncbi:MAG TPA: type II secretion system minor pseudopilin GspK [Rhodocyclaceae bacterium]|nr:type II secretion system minor pseudopilin GspK [Rhodocyclaceae bacterium]
MRTEQQGVAIILAMSVVALAAMAATAIMVSESTWSRQSELTTDHVQAQLLVSAGVDWVRAVLSDDRRISNVDYLGEPWALHLPPMPVENGELAGHIDDQQGAFNLNNLVSNGKENVGELARFQRLLAILGLPENLAAALVDWVDSDSEVQPQGGAEDAYYLALNPPYLAANRPLVDVAELSLVRGFDQDVRARLAPFVTALPGPTPVNVNTATPEVLAAVVDGLDLDGARALVTARERAYFRDTADFLSRLPKGAAVGTGEISVSSDYFLATLRVTIGDARARGQALLFRPDAKWPTILWRKYL